MVGNNLITPSYAILGAANDSLVTVVAYAGAVAFLVMMVGVFIGNRSEDSALRFLRIKPLLAPSFAFVITLFLVIALVPHPMANYHGLNETQVHYYEDGTATFRIYDSIAYQNAADIHVLCILNPSEELTVRVDIKQNGTIITREEFVLSGNNLDQAVTEDRTIQLQPGLYEIEIPGSNYYSVSLTQPLVSGFFNEVLAWESYSFMLIAGSFFFILGGLCIGREDRDRISQEEIDQEPPREGEVYIRRA